MDYVPNSVSLYLSLNNCPGTEQNNYLKKTVVHKGDVYRSCYQSAK